MRNSDWNATSRLEYKVLRTFCWKISVLMWKHFDIPLSNNMHDGNLNMIEVLTFLYQNWYFNNNNFYCFN